jgi:hypothetical protein
LTSDQTSTFLRPHRTVAARLFNLLGRALARCGLEVSVSEQRVLKAARRLARLGGWQSGGLAGLKEAGRLDWSDELPVPVKLLLEDVESDRALTPLGRLVMRVWIAGILATRKRLEALEERQPEIFEQPVRRPVFIIGFSRTGTSLLYNLLAQDPRARVPRLWEVLAPLPPPERDPPKRDRRVKGAERMVKTLYRMAPDLKVMHDYDPRGPEEDLPLLSNALLSVLFAGFLDARTYTAWYHGLRQEDAVPAYEEYRGQLQALQWRYRGEHWVLKTTSHQFFLEALVTVFPDAWLVQTHRDPLASIPSLCSLHAISRGVAADSVDLGEIGAGAVRGFVEASRRCIAARAALGESRFVDIGYETLVHDPVGVVRDLYERLGFPYDSSYEARMDAWLAGHPRHRHGVHRYSLEQFGLDAETVQRETAFYRERFAEYLAAPADPTVVWRQRS